MNEWTEFHQRHEDKIELIPGVDCWAWVGSVGRAGHGRVNHNRRVQYAHRLAYAAFHGREAEGLVRHLCGCSGCVRPTHLAEGTHADNAKDMALMGQSRSTLSLSEAASVRERYRAGVPLSEIAAEFGVPYGTVYPIVIGKSFKYLEAETSRGLRAPRKLNADTVREIRQRLNGGESQSAVARHFDVASSVISRIHTGDRWGSVQ